jgi:hypothetical protein
MTSAELMQEIKRVAPGPPARFEKTAGTDGERGGSIQAETVRVELCP